jgi:hypothetical protein
MPSDSSIASASAVEWMRIFACRLAQRRPELDARAVIDAAVQEFKTWHGVSPEAAVEHCSRTFGAH